MARGAKQAAQAKGKDAVSFTGVRGTLVAGENPCVVLNGAAALASARAVPDCFDPYCSLPTLAAEPSIWT